MTEEQLDRIHERKEAVYEAVHALVDSMTTDLTPTEDQLLRQVLTEDFRFWRRVSAAVDARTEEDEPESGKPSVEEVE
jgi:hypothetical protein